MALPDRCRPDELTTGKQPDLTYLNLFGCEVMTYVEKDKRTKFEPRADRGIYLGPSLLHSKDTYKIWNLATSTILLCRLDAVFNENIFSGRATKVLTTGEDLIGLDFIDEGGGIYHHGNVDHPHVNIY
jgi:hypothetical protein